MIEFQKCRQDLLNLYSFLKLLEEDKNLIQLPPTTKMDELFFSTYCAQIAAAIYSGEKDPDVVLDKMRELSKHFYKFSQFGYEVELLWVLKCTPKILSLCVTEDGRSFLPSQDQDIWFGIYNQVCQVSGRRLSEKMDFCWKSFKTIANN